MERPLLPSAPGEDEVKREDHTYHEFNDRPQLMVQRSYSEESYFSADEEEEVVDEAALERLWMKNHNDEGGDPSKAADAPVPHMKKPCCVKKQCVRPFQRWEVWCFRRRSDHLIATIYGVALFLLVCAVVMPFIADKILHDTIKEDLVVDSRSSAGYDDFVTNTGDDAPVMNYDLYMFDLQNGDDVVLGSKPMLVEKGPYAYTKYWNRMQVSWRNGGKIIQYYQQTWYTWDADRAGYGLDDSDLATNPNLVAFLLKTLLESAEASIPAHVAGYVENMKAQGALDPANQDAGQKAFVSMLGSALDIFDGQGWRGLLKLLLCVGPSGASPFQTRSVHDLYWGYWHDPILVFLKNVINAVAPGTPFLTQVPGISTNYSTPEAALHINNYMQTRTGKNEIKKINEYYRYMGMESLYVCLGANQSTGNDDEEIPAVCPPFDVTWTDQEISDNGWVYPWRDVDDCIIAGYNDGENFQPFVKNPRKAHRKIFIDDIYRSLYLKYENTYTWHDITLTRTGLDPKDIQTANCSWAWPSEEECNPDNARYFAHGPHGLLNMSKLSAGLPLFASKPHFLDGHPWLISQVTGLIPNADIHDTYLDLETRIGAPFRIAERLQLSTQLTDWKLPDLPLWEYFGWNETVTKEYEEDIVQGVVRKLEQFVGQAVAEYVEHEVEDWCAAEGQQHAQACREHAAELASYLDDAMTSYCAMNHTDTNTSEHACAVFAEVEHVINATEKAIHEVEEYCSANYDTCEQVVKVALQQAQEKCANAEPNSQTAEECERAEQVFQEVASVWSKISGFCTASVCDVIHEVELYCENTNATLREDTCESIDQLVEKEVVDLCNVTITFPKGKHDPIYLCTVLDNIIEHPGMYEDEMEAYCSCEGVRTIQCSVQKNVCKQAAKQIDTFCADSEKNEQECDVARHLIANWTAIDAEILEIYSDYTNLCAHTLCEASVPAFIERIDAFCDASQAHQQECTAVRAEVEGAVESFCDDGHETECEFVASVASAINWTAPDPIKSWAKDEVHQIEEDIAAWRAKANEWCAESHHNELCDVVRDIVKEDLATVFNLVVQYLNISSELASAADFAQCVASSTDWTLPEEGLYVPLSWTDEWLDLPHNDITAYNNLVTTPLKIARRTIFWFYVVSVGLFICATIIWAGRELTRRHTKRKYTKLGKLHLGEDLTQSASMWV